ncbi:MAG TPA: anti-sigma factor [Anaerolineales bacterium]|nr:anti-sigma factor [Anaerolineales bacterium]
MSDVCAEVELLMPGYALGALDEEDRELVLEHLRSCPDCHATLADYLAVREGLLLSPPAVHPPARLRQTLAASIRPSHVKTMGFLGSFGLRVSAWSGVAVLATLLVVNVIVLGQTSQMLRGQQTSLEQLLAEQSKLTQDLQANQTAMALVTYPTSEVVHVQGDEAYGTFVFDPDLNIAVLYAWGLEPLPGDETYQAWLIDAGGGRTNGGLFQVSEGTRFSVFIVSSSSPMGAFRGVGVTIEPSGGSPGPTGARVLAADF